MCETGWIRLVALCYSVFRVEKHNMSTSPFTKYKNKGMTNQIAICNLFTDHLDVLGLSGLLANMQNCSLIPGCLKKSNQLSKKHDSITGHNADVIRALSNYPSDWLLQAAVRAAITLIKLISSNKSLGNTVPLPQPLPIPFGYSDWTLKHPFIIQ